MQLHSRTEEHYRASESCIHSFRLPDFHCIFCNLVLHAQDSVFHLWRGNKDLREGFDSKFYPLLAAAEGKSFWFRARNHIIQYLLGKHSLSSGNYLEVGCGTGFVTAGIQKRFPELTCYGSELFSEALDFAKARIPSTTFLVMDATEIPFKSQFNIIGAFDVLEHIEDDIGAIHQIHSALKDEGIFLITVPCSPWLWGPMDDKAHHYRRYTKTDLKAKLIQSNFKIEESTYLFSLLLPLTICSRFLQSISKSTWNEESELKATTKYRLLDFVMTVELFLIKLGIRFPFGSSLVVVARKAVGAPREVSS